MHTVKLMSIEWNQSYDEPDFSYELDKEEYFVRHRKDFVKHFRELADRLENGIYPFPRKEA